MTNRRRLYCDRLDGVPEITRKQGGSQSLHRPSALSFSLATWMDKLLLQQIIVWAHSAHTYIVV